MRSKYGNRQIAINGEVFDSKKEAARWQELKLLELGGRIKNLQRQVVFEVIPTQRARQPDGSLGAVVLRSTHYIADFVYDEYKDGRWQKVVEDVKGFKTEGYILKKKLMYERYGILIKET